MVATGFEGATLQRTFTVSKSGDKQLRSGFLVFLLFFGCKRNKKCLCGKTKTKKGRVFVPGNIFRGPQN